jgi:hypothetical protein
MSVPFRRQAGIALAVASFTLFAAPPLTAQIVRIGGEIPVNAVTAGSQFAPSIATTADGGFVIAWQSADVDGSGFGIRARRFEADGAAATAEIAVNSATTGDQVSPSVAVLDDGAFVVVWTSNGADGSLFGIRARRFTAAGVPLSGELAVNSTTAGSQVSPRATSAAGAGFLAIWSGPGLGDSNEIFARAFDAAGLPLSLEFRVNSTVSGQQVSPAVTRMSDGSFAAAWASAGQDGSGYAVVARRFNAVGAFSTAEIAVPEITSLDQAAPAIVAVDGGFVVVWQRQLSTSSLPGALQPILAFRTFSGAGAPQTDEIPMHVDTSMRHEHPRASIDGHGRLLVAWREYDPDDPGNPNDPVELRIDAAAAIWDPDGTPLSGDFILNATLADDQVDPVLAGGAGGRFVAAWSSFAQDGSSFGVFAQRFGEPLEPCAEDATTLCLHDNRFRVRATFATAAGDAGDALAEALTDESGYFTFFDPENVEIVVKAIDACGLAGFENFWVFATGLTNVQVTMTVEDTSTGDFRVYTNALNHPFDPILDTSHFHVCAAAHAPAPAAARIESPRTLRPAAATGACVANATTLCLLGGRFEVTIDYTTAIPSSGAGHAVALTDESGYFWFFDDANVELVIKAIDGCSYNDRYWIFAGGLTDVGTELLVRDTEHPTATFERVKPVGVPFAPILAIDAFDTCP